MIRQDGDEIVTDPFRFACAAYRERGWLGTLPLPAGQKHPPPTGWTGRSAQFPGDEQIAKWVKMSRYKRGNIALHLGFPVTVGTDTFEVVGIDVDDYGDKHGGKQLKELEAEHGELPKTWISTSRALPSGIRFFRVPAGFAFRGKAAEGIDIIQKAHRYAVVWPSWNPDSDAPYIWIDPDGHDISDLDDLPNADELPELPEAWFQFLTNGGVADANVAVDMDSTDQELQAWAESGFTGGEPCERMRLAVEEWTRRIQDEESSHDKITQADWQLASLGVEGHTGWQDARAAVAEVYVATTLKRGKRSVGDVRGETGRSLFGVLRKLKAAHPGGRAACPCFPAEGTEDYKWAIAALAPGGGWHPDTPKPWLIATAAGRFRLVSARELAQPVKPLRWMVRGFWPEGSAGVLGADKKTFKTWNLQAMGIAVASGLPMFDEFEVTRAGGVLFLAGEGGQEAFANRHQVIAARYGIAPEEMAELPFYAEFGVASLSEQLFTDTVKAYLDLLQPKLVILDPLYAYHPQDVETSNLYARGQMLARLRDTIGGQAALVVGDHFKKTASGGLDLDNISMSGMSQWADSWVLQKHREEPDLDNDEYRLYVEVGTRRGGGRSLHIDWSLERDNSEPDLLMWKAADWAVNSAQKRSSTKGDGASGSSRAEQKVEQVLRDQPAELTVTQIVKEVGGNRDLAFSTIDSMIKRGRIEVATIDRQEGKRKVAREMLTLVDPAPAIPVSKLRGDV